MNKRDIIEKIAEDSGITKEQAVKVINSIFNGIENALSRGEKVTLSGFGSFSVIRRKERKARNPRTGEIIKIPSKKAIKFVPSKKLKEIIK
ncbi:HU family DNA-binding protein [Candidatus Aminicenantes bacterium AC-708-M15]|jgi:DNA-binding protein HU-beta|nr:HU family DNA-binding protein [SCandidatus Aminicenantes bacterium Aminicenantia_JdfR_composite]MCP2598205.1 HU family DNA-binding protein [Candidatus Aminicenantes bacterium AC-335-L06]MCP2603962.1 HU family DNA-binding protein [Candidatus Aminicenantes bacterium AC-708-M15]MCP2605582.1 HU family DNA-binding protein [Candidatus Aminicenantes bacterium AC-335-O07]